MRGEIWTSYNKDLLNYKIFRKLKCLHEKFVLNKKNVLRGLHGDLSSFKLVSCPYGEVFQVAADFRKNSPSFGRYYSTILSQKNKKKPTSTTRCCKWFFSPV